MLKDLSIRMNHRAILYEHTDKRNEKTGEIEILPVDPFAYSPGLVNPCGFPMNDIYAYEHAASDSIAEAILARINPSFEDTNAAVPIEDKIAQCIPRGWSSPAEYTKYSRKVAEHFYNKQKNLEEMKKVNQSTIEFNKEDQKTAD